MALRDLIENAIKYFGVGSVEEFEENQGGAVEVNTAQPEASRKKDIQEVRKPAPQKQQGPHGPEVSPRGATRPQTVTQESDVRRISREIEEGSQKVNTRPEAGKQSTANQSNGNNVMINIKYPRKYEDASDIVDLFVKGECVIIDFQHMAENQALRCIDYLDGARFVEDGDLKKIASSMWLLTPGFVKVNVDEQNTEKNRRDAYDFDLKRR